MNRSNYLKSVVLSLPLTVLLVVETYEFPESSRCRIFSNFQSKKVVAQPIVPEPNSTNTVTTQQGNRIDIEGGKISENGANLFHSFTEFNVESGQVANFLSNNSIQNILTRVVGGNASLINGLIQVTGGNANLFLMNPAGVIFGSNARLNIPASFTVTTATGIGLGSNWFNAVGNNDYASLVETPNAFRFSATESGSIINAGQLAVASGENLSLLGNNVINTGELIAPGGQITIAAIPGEQILRISQTGHLLNLEVATTDMGGYSSEIAPLSLPQLLTGGDRQHATGVTVLADGRVQLTHSETEIPTSNGVAVVSGSTTAEAGSVNIVGETVGLVDAKVDVSGVNGGGTIRIGGDQRGSGLIPNANSTFINRNSSILANAEVTGNAGQIIIWSDLETRFFGKINAQSVSGNGGFAEISSYGNLTVDGSVDLRGANGSVGTLLLDPLNITIVDGEAIENENSLRDNQILAENNPSEFTISEMSLERIGETADIVLEARNNITLNDLADNQLNLQASSGSVTFTADADGDGKGSFSMSADDSIQTAGGTITITGVDLNIGDLSTNGGNIFLSSTFNGEIEIGQVSTANASGSGGDIAITTNQGKIYTGDLQTNGLNQSGDINLNSGRRITTGEISTQALNSTSGEGGDVSINAVENIEVDLVNSSGSQQAGNIRISSEEGNVNFSSESYSLDATSAEGSGGNIEINTPQKLSLNSVNAKGRTAGGNINLEAEVEINAEEIRTGSFDNSSQNIEENETRLNGNITLTSDEINLSNLVEGNGSLILQPATDAQDIVIANRGNRSGLSLDLTTDEMATLQDGFTQIIIGRTDSKGTVSIGGNLTVQDPILIQSPLGRINTETNSSGSPYTLTGVDNASLTFNALNDISLGNLITNGENITVTSQSGQIITQQIQNTGSRQATIQLTANEIDFVGGNNSILGNGFLRLQPYNNRQAITLGNDGNTEALELSGRDLNALANGFELITIGRSNSSGPMTVAGDITFRDPVILRSPNFPGFVVAQGTITGVDNAAIQIKADGNLFLSDISTTGQTLQLTSTDRQITTGNLQSGGEINLQAAEAIETGNLNISSNSVSNSTQANPQVNLVSQQSDVVVRGNINTNPNSNLTGVNIQAGGRIQTNNITSTQEIRLTAERGEIVTGNLSSAATEDAGNITIQSGDRITTGTLEATSSDGNGGNIRLVSPNDIEVTSINTEAANNGGNIEINTQRFFRATGTFTAANQVEASVSTIGSDEGGSIVLPSLTSNTFEIGDATLNGTVGGITNGEITALPPTNNAVNPPQKPETNEDNIPPENPNQTPDNQEPVIQDNPLEPTTENPSNPSESGEIPLSENLDSPTEVITEDDNLSNNEEIAQEIENIPIQLEGTTVYSDQIATSTFSSSVLQIDLFRGQEFIKYFGENINKNPVSDQSIRQTLSDITKLTGHKPAIVYVSIQANQLEMRLVLPDGQPLFKSTQIKREDLLKVVREFNNQIRTPRSLSDTEYKITGKQLYDWLILPLKAELEKHQVKTLIFSMDAGLRTLPIAALYDGEKFLLEDYSLALIPSLSLTDTSYVHLKNSKVLAMGASKFTDPSQEPLPAVPVELSLIVKENQWQGQSFLNEEFTIDNLTNQRKQKQFDIIHLATHGEFLAGGANRSYIQFWDQKLWLDQLRQLRLDQPPVELLVLSACTTAVGDEEAELGFAGLAIQAGVKSALASLWYVSDAGTLGLMSTFYDQLLHSPIKAEALRQAQLAMLQGKVRLEAGKLVYQKKTITADVELPPEIAARGDVSLSHPFYWAGFTLIGSPW